MDKASYRFAFVTDIYEKTEIEMYKQSDRVAILIELCEQTEQLMDKVSSRASIAAEKISICTDCEQ